MNVLNTSVLVLALAAFAIGADASGDSHPRARPGSADPLAAIPTARRERLRQRLREFVQLEAAENYRGAYSYLSQMFKASVASGLTVEAYLQRPPSKRLVRFAPEACIELAPDHYMLDGCAEYERFGPNLRLESGVEAVFERGDWYFSEIEVSLPCLHCRPRGCRLGVPFDTAPN